MALDWLLRPILLVFINIFILPSISSTSESEALIKLKSSFTDASALSSWVNGSTPCAGDTQWNGLLCSNGTVVGLRLEKMGLSGKIDVDALIDISGLRTVSFARNSFSGSIPELSRLGYLKSIFLTGNQFSGEIPSDFFLKMVSLKKVWLSDNKFSGEIPSSLIHLSNLLELRLENNEFSGNIPSIEQSTLTTFNVSNNKLRGQIPAGLEKFNSTSFEGNSELCGEMIGKECRTVSLAAAALISSVSKNAIYDKDSKSLKMTNAGIITLAAMLLSVVGVVIFKLSRKDKDFQVGGKDGSDADESVEVQVTMPVRSKEMEATKKLGSTRKGSNQNKGGGVAELVMVNNEKGVFGLPDLMKAAAEVLGNGGLGSSYKALMTDGEAMVVKRLREMNALGRDGFDAEVRHLGKLRHPNILGPLAFHYRKDEKLLIYEYMPTGSLLYLLHGDRGPSRTELNWPTRLKVVVGIARGLGYLHAELSSFDLPHGNLKSSNIFLNYDNEPMISEFGFNQLTKPSVGRQALLAYKAPEAAQFGVSPKCDVYCLGLVILEILTGKVPSQYLNYGNGEIDLVQWVQNSITEGRESELFDPDIASSTDSVGEIRALLHIGARCAESNPAQRLDLREAIERIEEIKLGIGYSDNRTMQLLPSLRDGYADSPPPFNPSTSTKEGYGETSKRGRGSCSFTDSSQFSFASPGSTFLSNDN
ncbi:pollen receptor-like kinase 3 [Ricinus communis]|uniref:Serine/threonine-protein kinase PBS1, putative n=1 Tax=Ricinus communis TaxID=3988 RepID=B9T3B1_RICCO|nr:pollen receptor-like kinase 3 [Ricinus communis]EEF29661.1 Serine/threonine-protein kinase PBS1, putative [Ricinus communis]|eukprot:XP_002532730.1 pollen receptor-like kinase 3 [Ricinus communis]